MNREMIDAIKKDGIVDASEVVEIRADIFDDGVIDQQEVKDLFELNDAVSGNANHEDWQQLMIDAVSSYCLEDETSPGVIDQEEGDFLAGLIMGDEQVDIVEVAVLTALRDNAESIESEKLNALIVNLS